MKVLFIGDIVGEPGRKMVKAHISALTAQYRPDLIIANGENAAGGFGITSDIAEEFFSLGIHVLTSGNHVWDKKEIEPYLTKHDRLIRPANYPDGNLGFGSVVISTAAGKAAVLNLEGRVFMSNLEDPFRVGMREIERLKKETQVVIIDFHAEATSEKIALAWYLDGMASAVIGTHTHVQTADERILPGGTAFLTDAGMTGPTDSVIGVKKEEAIARFLSQSPHKFSIPKGPTHLDAVVIEVDASDGKAKSIERIKLKSQF
ncbi:MAG TPA: TIGR00282 family metallophosphoesterase [Nitrospiraceae bacterium]|nr:TIGR00282 family metallophosphoesterase [Nitrospiraceae bacterium]HAS54144.1 TIGR00282 family metallophosphoesterase [Nitrospiraceae bacterium]